MFVQPIFARCRLQMADKINEGHDHNRENVRAGERGNKQRKRREQTCFQVNDDDSGKDIDVEG